MVQKQNLNHYNLLRMEFNYYKKTQPIIGVGIEIVNGGKFSGIPHVIISTTGCPMRCQFCKNPKASWSSSGKGKYSLNYVIRFIEENPQLRHTKITGGSPTTHSKLIKVLCQISKRAGHHVSIETEGSNYVGTVADFISISPKLSNSVPRIGAVHYNGILLTETAISNHEKHRRNYNAMRDMLTAHPDYQVKMSISNITNIEEAEVIMEYLNIPKDKVYLIPEMLEEGYDEEWLVDYCCSNGYNFSKE